MSRLAELGQLHGCRVAASKRRSSVRASLLIGDVRNAAVAREAGACHVPFGAQHLGRLPVARS